MEFAILGPLEVRIGERVLGLAGRKQRALLAILLLHPNEVVSADRLIDGLWGKHPPAGALRTLHAYVSRLRKALDLADDRSAHRLLTANGYCLRVEPGELDVDRCRALVEEGRKALANGDAERAATSLRAALALWRGPPLAEFSYDAFAQSAITELEELHLVTLEERIEADLALGRHGEVVGELEGLIGGQQHRERLRGQLMLALYRAGRHPEALAAYRSGREALDELGLEPSLRLRQLERQILTQDPALGLKREPPLPGPLSDRLVLPGPLVPASPFPFVGRSQQLAALRDLLARAEGGEGGLVLLAGEAGGGKTRLVRELAHDAAAAGFLVCYGASDPAVKVPYQPLREWFEFLLRVCDSQALAECLGNSSDALARLVPAFANLTGAAASPPSGDATTERYLLQAAVAELLRRLSGLQPLLLVAEDLHWSDSDTLLLIARLARTAPEARALVVATFRPPADESDRRLADTLADLSRLDGATRLTLGNLTSEDMGAFVRDSTEAEATAELVAAVAELTSGTPLLLCELWRDLVASGGIVISESQVSLARPVAELRGPERIHWLVQQRLARLSPETAAVIELAAAAGSRFELDVVAAAAELERSALADAIDSASRSGIVEELPETTPAYRFTHELVRRAIYDRITGIRRAVLHLRVAEALEQTHAADPGGVLAALAHHFTLAVPVAGAERAVEYNLRASEAAAASLAYGEAAARLTTALELGIGDPHERARVQAELGYLLYQSGRMSESEAILAASLDAAISLEERGLAAHALVRSSFPRLLSDPAVGSAEIVPVAEESIKTFEQLGDSLGLAMGERLLGAALSREGRTAEGFAAFERALVHAEATGDHGVKRQIIGDLGHRLCDGPTAVGEAIDRLEELRSASRHVPVLEAGLRRCLALVLAMAGRFDESGEHILASSPVLDHVGLRGISWASRVMVAEAKELAGDASGAEQELVAQFLAMRDARGEESEARALRATAMLALLYGAQGRWDEAAEYLSYGQRVDQSEPTEGKVYSFLRLAARGRLEAHRGRHAEALALARHAVEVAERSDRLSLRARVWLALAEVQKAGGQTAEAGAAIAKALSLYEAKGNVAAAAPLRLQRAIRATGVDGADLVA